jgi:hypothetical protein
MPDNEVKDPAWAAQEVYEIIADYFEKAPQTRDHVTGWVLAGRTADDTRAIIQQSNDYAVAQASPAIVAKAKADATNERLAFAPVDQTVFGGKVGNCHRAAMATLLGVPLKAVRDIMNETPPSENWMTAEAEWLGAYGFGLLYIDLLPDGKLPWMYPLPDKTPCLIGGKSPRGDFQHSVVGRYRRDETGCWLEWAHDPHPDRTWLEQAKDVAFLICTDSHVVHAAIAAHYQQEADNA